MELSFDVVKAFSGGFGVGAVHVDMSGGFAGSSDEGYAAQFFLHQPLEDNGQPAIDKENVEHRGVVGNEDIGLTGVDVFFAIDGDRNEEPEEEEATP